MKLSSMLAAVATCRWLRGYEYTTQVVNATGLAKPEGVDLRDWCYIYIFCDDDSKRL